MPTSCNVTCNDISCNVARNTIGRTSTCSGPCRDVHLLPHLQAGFRELEDSRTGFMVQQRKRFKAKLNRERMRRARRQGKGGGAPALLEPGDDEILPGSPDARQTTRRSLASIVGTRTSLLGNFGRGNAAAGEGGGEEEEEASSDDLSSLASADIEKMDFDGKALRTLHPRGRCDAAGRTVTCRHPRAVTSRYHPARQSFSSYHAVTYRYRAVTASFPCHYMPLPSRVAELQQRLAANEAKERRSMGKLDMFGEATVDAAEAEAADVRRLEFASLAQSKLGKHAQIEELTERVEKEHRVTETLQERLEAALVDEQDVLKVWRRLNVASTLRGVRPRYVRYMRHMHGLGEVWHRLDEEL